MGRTILIFVFLLGLHITVSIGTAHLIDEVKPSGYDTMSANVGDIPESPILYVPVFAIGALCEEMTFRLFPFFLIIIVMTFRWGANIKMKWTLIPVIIITSIIFGWIHGNYLNILIQGIGGLFYWAFFLFIFYYERGNELQYELNHFESYKVDIGKTFIKSFMGSSALHFSYNICIVLLVDFIPTFLQ